MLSRQSVHKLPMTDVNILLQKMQEILLYNVYLILCKNITSNLIWRRL